MRPEDFPGAPPASAAEELEEELAGSCLRQNGERLMGDQSDRRGKNAGILNIREAFCLLRKNFKIIVSVDTAFLSI